MAEPTAALTFEDLILETSRFIGTAFYGADGAGVAQIPTDVHDLDEAKRTVNNGIRRFITNAPPTGWRWMRPVAAVVTWPDVAVLATLTVTATFGAGITTYTASAPTFFESMEEKTIKVTGESDVVLETFVSTTVMTVASDTSFVGSKTFSIASVNTFTLPKTFGGSYRGAITVAAGTNQGVPIVWTNEARIRQLLENTTTQTGDPRFAAIRPFTPTSVAAGLTGSRRRWELMVYPISDTATTLNFPFHLYFDTLTVLTEVHPAPFLHDECVKAACLATAERDVNNTVGVMTGYYEDTCLPNSWRIDLDSAPSRLGKFGDPGNAVITPINFRDFSQRPTVSFVP